MAGAITFDHVAFGYDPAIPVLRDVNFSIAPGQLVGVVGATGAGKSTMMGLLPRFFDPSSGTVLIDGIDVREYKLNALRQQIAMVLQNRLWYFRCSVRDNIAYGRPAASDTEIENAAQLAGGSTGRDLPIIAARL